MTEFKTIHHPSEIPQFQTEAEEAAFWESHEFGQEMFQGALEDTGTQELLALIPKRPKSKPISLRLGAELERRLRILAEMKGTTYQTLMKEFVLERVYEEEKRLGIIR